MSRSRAVRLVNGALLTALFGSSLWAWSDSPERIPGHFGASRQVTRWSDSSVLSWLLLRFVAAGLAALQYGIAALLDGRLHLFNVPEKDRFLQLPPERQQPVTRLMKRFLHESATVLILLIGAHQWVRFRAALAGQTENYTAILLVASALLMPLVLFVWLVPIQREVREQWRMHAEETGPAIR